MDAVPIPDAYPPDRKRKKKAVTTSFLKTQPAPRFSFHDLGPDSGSFLEDVIRGLARGRKELPPKYFYDERGCALFDAICELPEYYPTRTEIGMMQARAAEMARHLGPGCVLIEYGSGSGRKTRLLLEKLRPIAYVPVDIACTQLRDSAGRVAREFPDLAVIAVCADYSRPLALPGLEGIAARRRVVYFPGSTIGNFTPGEAVRFLGNARALTGEGGGLLIGVDLKKDPSRLHAAYNDAQGVTAEFNLNLLTRINRELGANFDLSAFRHQAFYNAELGRIEMHLSCVRGQRVDIAGNRFDFRAGDTVHTENSYKYTVAEFQEVGRSAGFVPLECWTDPDLLFSVHYMTVSN
ncbi:MAG: L-histidine N(alpha)-methyltransferase [Betaproteobacteria bacterium]|nr:L-histidine N(alpha)-methyltransferase [Betaproteobacteria bacterium]